MTAGVYRIRNRLNGYAYIGQSANIATRWATHRQQLARESHPNRALQDDWNTCGPAAFAIGILEVVEPAAYAALIAAERRWLQRYKCDTLYNVAFPLPVAERSGPGGRRMIHCTLARLLTERGITLAELQRQTGSVTYANLHRLANNRTTRYDATTLDAICRALGVGVGDLLEYRAEPGEPSADRA